jgi:hypothetical protein
VEAALKFYSGEHQQDFVPRELLRSLLRECTVAESVRRDASLRGNRLAAASVGRGEVAVLHTSGAIGQTLTLAVLQRQGDGTYEVQLCCLLLAPWEISAREGGGVNPERGGRGAVR